MERYHKSIGQNMWNRAAYVACRSVED